MDLLERELTQEVVGAAIEVHRELGPGLLNPAYRVRLAHDLARRRIPFQQDKLLPVTYKRVWLDCGYRVDLLDEKVLVELNTVEVILSVHKANYSLPVPHWRAR